MSSRIVLVNPLGDVLFSGESWLAHEAESPATYDDAAETLAAPEVEECPPTLRSAA